jgi:uncharacterized protein with FMN-binding domain
MRNPPNMQIKSNNQPIKKFVVAAFIVATFLLYSLIHARFSSADVLPISSVDLNNSTKEPISSSTTPTATATGTTSIDSPDPTATATTATNSLYKDGSYTGKVADAQWGDVQVKAIIKSGKITDVQFLQYPNNDRRSQQINQYATPRLTQEAIQVQSAQVDIITGATLTSRAFIESLSDALSQAKAK